MFFLLLKERFVFRPDIVFYTFSPNKWAFLRDFIFSVFLKLSSSKKVFVIREQIKEGKIKKFFFQLSFSGSTVIVLSENYKSKFEAFLKGLKIEVIKDGLIPLSEEEIKRSHFKNPPVLLFLSNLVRDKGIYVFLEALKILKERNVDFKSIIAGAPVELKEEDLRKLLIEYGLSNNVEYRGYVKGKEKIDTYLDSDIFILPTLKETFPGVILEAMEFALPVISTKEGGIPDIIVEGETGFIIEKDNVHQLAERIEFLIKNERFAIKMGGEGRKRFLNNFTFDKMERRYLELFKRILDE